MIENDRLVGWTTNGPMGGRKNENQWYLTVSAVTTLAIWLNGWDC
jgi:hypothetical protein